MPYFYDLARTSTSSTAAGVEVVGPHLSGIQKSSGETISITGMFLSARGATAGGATWRLKDNISSTGGTVTGGTNMVADPKNRRASIATPSSWMMDASAITAGNAATLGVRISVGFAQTGGMGGYVPIVPSAAVQLLPGSTLYFNPTDLEFTSISASTGIVFDWTVEFGEGI